MGIMSAAAAAAKSLQSCPTLCNPIDGSPPGSSAHGIFQARVLEWGAIAFSRELIRSIAFSRELIRSPKMSQLKITQVNHLPVLHIRAPTQTTGSAPEVGRMHSSPASPRGRPTPSPLPPSGGHLLPWAHGALSASAQPAGSRLLPGHTAPSLSLHSQQGLSSPLSDCLT